MKAVQGHTGLEESDDAEVFKEMLPEEVDDTPWTVHFTHAAHRDMIDRTGLVPGYTLGLRHGNQYLYMVRTRAGGRAPELKRG